MLSMIKKEGDSGPVGELFDKLPGADDMAEDSSGGGGGLLGGLTGALGNLGGGAASGLAGLASSGLGADKLKDIAHMLVDYAKKIAGEDLVDKVVGSVPALKSIL